MYIHVAPSQSVSAYMLCTLGRRHCLFVPYRNLTSHLYDISGERKQSWHRRSGGGVAFVSALIGVQMENVKCLSLSHSTHFIFEAEKSVQGPQDFFFQLSGCRYSEEGKEDKKKE